MQFFNWKDKQGEVKKRKNNGTRFDLILTSLLKTSLY